LNSEVENMLAVVLATASDTALLDSAQMAMSRARGENESDFSGR